MTEYLGMLSATLLKSGPFNNWPVDRTVVEDLDEPRIHYLFEGNGLEVSCDVDERISTLFLFSEDHGGFDESLFEIPFSLTRDQVRDHFGSPSKSGEGRKHPILGEYGAWDRFRRPGMTIHVEYHPSADRISKITLMRADAVP